MDLLSTRKLNNGVEIPWLGFGVFLSAVGDETKQAVTWALEAGYRHIDTAAAYENEADVARGIKESGVAREDIFITTKLSTKAMRADNQQAAFEASLRALNTDYLDLYLIHWPVPGKFIDSWKMMEKWYKEGKIRSIGVSNFQNHHIDELMAECEVMPVLNQIEYHPYLTQEDVIAFDEGKGIAAEAWSPLGGSWKGISLLSDKTIASIAEKHGKTPAQVILKWDLQNKVITIPKSVHKERIIQNTQLFDFALTNEEMAAISALNENRRVGPDPDNFDF